MTVVVEIARSFWRWEGCRGCSKAAVGDLEHSAFVVGAARLRRPEKVAFRVRDQVGAQSDIWEPIEIDHDSRRAFIAGRNVLDDLEYHRLRIFGLGTRVRGSEKVAIGVHDQGFGAIKIKLSVRGVETSAQGGRGAGVTGRRLLDFKHRAVVIVTARNRGPEDVALGVYGQSPDLCPHREGDEADRSSITGAGLLDFKHRASGRAEKVARRIFDQVTKTRRSDACAEAGEDGWRARASLEFEHRACAMGAARQRCSKQIAAGVDKQPPPRVGGADDGCEVRQDFGAARLGKFDDRAEVICRAGEQRSGRKGRHSHRR